MRKRVMKERSKVSKLSGAWSAKSDTPRIESAPARRIVFWGGERGAHRPRPGSKRPGSTSPASSHNLIAAPPHSEITRCPVSHIPPGSSLRGGGARLPVAPRPTRRGRGARRARRGGPKTALRLPLCPPTTATTAGVGGGGPAARCPLNLHYRSAHGGDPGGRVGGGAAPVARGAREGAHRGRRR
jgi:hypothetical protein